MLEQTATVKAVQHGRLLLEVIPQSTCGSCSVKSGCGTSVLASSVGQKVVRFELDNTLDAVVGDRVVIGVPENAVVGGSLLMYLVPLLVMFAFAMISDQLLSLQDASRDIKIASVASRLSMMWGLCSAPEIASSLAAIRQLRICQLQGFCIADRRPHMSFVSRPETSGSGPIRLPAWSSHNADLHGIRLSPWPSNCGNGCGIPAA